MVSHPGPTYTQFTQIFAREGSQPLVGALVTVVPIGLAPQPTDTEQSRLLSLVVEYLSALLHPIRVQLLWSQDLGPRNMKYMLMPNRQSGLSLNVFSVVDLLQRRFGAASTTDTFGERRFTVALSPYPFQRVPQQGPQPTSVVHLAELLKLVQAQGPTSASANALQRWCATIGNHCLMTVVGLRTECTWFHCRLNPYEVAKAAPFCWHLCPVCLRKLSLVLGMTGKTELLLKRYSLLANSYKHLQASRAAQWVADRVAEATGEAISGHTQQSHGGCVDNGGSKASVEVLIQRLVRSNGRDVTYGELLDVRNWIVNCLLFFFHGVLCVLSPCVASFRWTH